VYIDLRLGRAGAGKIIFAVRAREEEQRERERGGGKEPELKRGIATDGSAFANSITRIDERAEPSGD